VSNTSNDDLSLSPWWKHAAILVMIAGFSVLSLVTVLTYTNAPPIPERVTDVTETVVFTGADIQKGQEVFLKHGLMEHGSLWGHGAYLGPDYSAEYLHRLGEVTSDRIAIEKYGKPFAQLSPDEQSGLRMVGDMVFLLAGALPIALGVLRSVWKRDLSPTKSA
jgi:nitric oxide reductase subunit B